MLADASSVNMTCKSASSSLRCYYSTESVDAYMVTVLGETGEGDCVLPDKPDSVTGGTEVHDKTTLTGVVPDPTS